VGRDARFNQKRRKEIMEVLLEIFYQDGTSEHIPVKKWVPDGAWFALWPDDGSPPMILSAFVVKKIEIHPRKIQPVSIVPN